MIRKVEILKRMLISRYPRGFLLPEEFQDIIEILNEIEEYIKETNPLKFEQDFSDDLEQALDFYEHDFNKDKLILDETSIPLFLAKLASDTDK